VPSETSTPVRKAPEKVPGVIAVKVDFASKRAQALFDPKMASVDALTNPVVDAGYPSHVRQAQ
jgi:mercuric ion binding protein